MKGTIIMCRLDNNVVTPTNYYRSKQQHNMQLHTSNGSTESVVFRQQAQQHRRRSHLVIYLNSETRSIDNASIITDRDDTTTDNDRIEVLHERCNSSTPYYDIKRCYFFLKVLIRLIPLQSYEQRKQYNNTFPNSYNSYYNDNNNLNLVRQIKSIMRQCIIQNRLIKTANCKNNIIMPSLREIIVCNVRNINGIEYYWNLTRDYLGYDLF